MTGIFVEMRKMVWSFFDPRSTRSTYHFDHFKSPNLVIRWSISIFDGQTSDWAWTDQGDYGFRLIAVVVGFAENWLNGCRISTKTLSICTKP
jgi:hypothetical protein